MIAHGSIRGLVAFVVLGCGVVAAQSTLPPMPPTQLEKPTHRAFVVIADGRLTVTADNSSLNDILRVVARRTGVKVKGGVIDEQVYGKYGPAPVADVLAVLLQDTSSNMMLALDVDTAQFQLVLTPRQGRPTPPNPHPVEMQVAKNEAPAPPVEEAAPVVENTTVAADQGNAGAGQNQINIVAVLGQVPDARPSSNPDPAATATIAQNQILTSIF
jgi:hypothetical protein